MPKKYTGSEAIVGLTPTFGTKVFIDGLEIQEVVKLEITSTLDVLANFLPASEGHQHIIRHILNGRPVEVEVETPDELHTSMYFFGSIFGRVSFPLNDVVRISFEMLVDSQYSLSTPNPADDGPEVGIIQNERFNQIWEDLEEDLRFEGLIRNYFKAERLKEEFLALVPGPPEVINIGGGFILVRES